MPYLQLWMLFAQLGLASKYVDKLDGWQLHVNVTEPVMQVVYRAVEVWALDECKLQVMLPGIGKCTHVLKTSSHGLQPWRVINIGHRLLTHLNNFRTARLDLSLQLLPKMHQALLQLGYKSQTKITVLLPCHALFWVAVSVFLDLAVRLYSVDLFYMFLCLS